MKEITTETFKDIKIGDEIVFIEKNDPRNVIKYEKTNEYTIRNLKYMSNESMNGRNRPLVSEFNSGYFSIYIESNYFNKLKQRIISG